MKNSMNIEEIIRKYSNYVYKIISNQMQNELTLEDKEEIISDIFFILWKNQNVIDKNKDLKPYIAGITKNVIKTKLKNCVPKYKNECDIEDFQNILYEEKTVELNIEKAEIFNQLIQEIKKLDNSEYQILINYYYKEKKVKEIAKEFKLSESKVKITLFRIRKKLKKLLKERGM